VRPTFAYCASNVLGFVVTSVMMSRNRLWKYVSSIFEVGVSAEERRDAERLQHRRLLDAEAGARLDLRLAKNSGWPMRHVDHGPARYDGRAEAVVPLDASSGGDEHARPEHLILSRRADVVARVERPGTREAVVGRGALAVPVGEHAEQVIPGPRR